MSFVLEPLNLEFISSLVKIKNWQLISKLEIFNTITSTNTYLLECAKANSASGHIVLANQQTQGRGRQQKKWFSPKDANIYFSCLWRFDNLQFELSGLAIAIAVIVANVLGEYGVTEGIQLKWPNDIFYLGKKLGGILLESNSLNSVVIGIGINLYLSPQQLGNIDTEAISLYQINNCQPQRNQLIALLINALIEQIPVFEKKGVAAFVHDWRRFDAFLGKNVIVCISDKTISGKMMGINEQGELLVKDENGILQCFRSGEVSLKKGIDL